MLRITVFVVKDIKSLVASLAYWKPDINYPGDNIISTYFRQDLQTDCSSCCTYSLHVNHWSSVDCFAFIILTNKSNIRASYYLKPKKQPKHLTFALSFWEVCTSSAYFSIMSRSQLCLALYLSETIKLHCRIWRRVSSCLKIRIRRL